MAALVRIRGLRRFAFAVWLASASVAQAQDALDEAPEETLAEDPETRALADTTEADKLGKKEADRRARDAFERGRSAWDEGDFRSAWEHWHLSYRLSRRPELLYNVGQAADRLRMDRDALAAFRMYLEKNPKAPNRKEVERRIVILEEELERQRQQEKSPEADHPQLDGESDPASASESADETTAPGATPQPERDGWYLRASLGLGVFADGISDTAGNDSSAGSVSIVLDAWIGYGVHEKVAIGGAVLIDKTLSPSITQNGGTSADLESLGLQMLAVFGDYYFEPSHHGFHLLGALGIGSLVISDQSASLGNNDGGGAALIAGAGYEWPMGGKWALGVQGRIVLGRFSTDTHDHTVFAPSVSATAAFF